MTTKVDEYEGQNAASLVLLGCVLGFGVASCAQLCGGVPCRNLLTLLMVGSMVVVHILVVLTLRVSVLFYNRASRLDVIDIGFAFSSRLSWAHKHRTCVGFRANNSDRSICGLFHPIFGIFNFVGWNLHGYGVSGAATNQFFVLGMRGRERKSCCRRTITLGCLCCLLVPNLGAVTSSEIPGMEGTRSLPGAGSKVFKQVGWGLSQVLASPCQNLRLGTGSSVGSFS
jgi:TM2 domain-containing membrane protein YozV